MPKFEVLFWKQSNSCVVSVGANSWAKNLSQPLLYNICCAIWMLQCQDNYDTVLWLSQRLLWTEVPWFSHGGSCMKQQYWFYIEQCTTPLLFLFHISEVSQCAWIQVSQVLCRAPMKKLKVNQSVVLTTWVTSKPGKQFVSRYTFDWSG